jgi:hypothetical protein
LYHNAYEEGARTKASFEGRARFLQVFHTGRKQSIVAATAIEISNTQMKERYVSQ